MIPRCPPVTLTPGVLAVIALADRQEADLRRIKAADREADVMRLVRAEYGQVVSEPVPSRIRLP